MDEFISVPKLVSCTSQIRSATITNARNMCTVMVQGVRLVETTKEPSQPWNPTRTSAAPAMTGNRLEVFQKLREYTNTAKMRKPMVTPTRRFTYSIQVLTGLK